jgi:streptogramin lyase
MLIVAGAAAFLSGGDDDESAVVPKPSATDPAGRIAATIPLGATPGSIAVGRDALWAATSEGTVLRIDPRTNEVVGAPIRFAEARENENVTIRAADGKLWALDGSGGTLTRIDPERGRVTGRLRIGGILHGAAVGNGSVWISRAPPGKGPRQVGELVRVDTDSFRRVGKPIPIGPGAYDVEVGDGFVWTMNGGDGTLTRYDMDSGSTRTVRVSAQPIGAALLNGTLWIPDPIDGTVTPLDARGVTPPDEVVRGTSHPFSVAATTNALWAVAVSEPSASAPASLYRIEPASRRIAGRPVALGPDVGWATAGFGSLWVYSRSKKALLRIAPASPPPTTSPAPSAVGDPRPIQAGPLLPGRWRTVDFAAPLTLEVDGRGWLAFGPQADVTAFGRFDSPDTFLEIIAPKQVFNAKGGVQKLNDPAEIVAALTSNPNVRILSREQVRVGGIPAEQLTVHVRRFEPFPDFCPTPCVPVFPLGLGTVAISSHSDERLAIMEVGGRIVVLHEYAPQAGKGFAGTRSLLRGLRFKNETA